MPDPTRETIVPLDIAGIAFVSEMRHPNSKLALTPSGEMLREDVGFGIVLAEATVGSEIEARTANNVYRLTHVQLEMIEISGHPEYCPRPVRVPLSGTRWLDRFSPQSFLAPGMSLQFIDRSGRTVLTSRIQSLRVTG